MTKKEIHNELHMEISLSSLNLIGHLLYPSLLSYVYHLKN